MATHVVEGPQKAIVPSRHENGLPRDLSRVGVPRLLRIMGEADEGPVPGEYSPVLKRELRLRGVGFAGKSMGDAVLNRGQGRRTVIDERRWMHEGGLAVGRRTA